MPTDPRIQNGLNETESPAAPLSALEISGAICARVVHDLANLIGGIMGNAEYAQDEGADPAHIRKALQAITLSANSAGQLLGQCLPLQRLITSEIQPCDCGELAAIIAEAGTQSPGWAVFEPRDLFGQVRVQPRWLAAAIWQITQATASPNGEIEFACGPAIFPVVWRGVQSNPAQPPALFQITLRYRADQPLLAGNELALHDQPALMAAQELVRRFRGQIHSRPKPPGRQEISILLPLVC